MFSFFIMCAARVIYSFHRFIWVKFAAEMSTWRQSVIAAADGAASYCIWMWGKSSGKAICLKTAKEKKKIGLHCWKLCVCECFSLFYISFVGGFCFSLYIHHAFTFEYNLWLSFYSQQKGEQKRGAEKHCGDDRADEEKNDLNYLSFYQKNDENIN